MQKKGCSIKIILLKDLRKKLEQPVQTNSKIDSLIDQMSLFDRMADMEPTYHSSCLFYGAFQNDVTGVTRKQKLIIDFSENEHLKDQMRALFESNGWNPVSHLEYYVQETEHFGPSFDHHFVMVGDITAERFAAGELQAEYRKIEEYKQKYKFGVYAESDFFSIGKNHYAPVPRIQLDSIEGLTVCCKGEFKKGRVFQNNCIKAHGGIHQFGFPTKATDVFVVSDVTFESCSCDSIRLADSIEKCWKSYQKTGRPLLFTESDFSAMGYFEMPGKKMR